MKVIIHHISGTRDERYFISRLTVTEHKDGTSTIYCESDKVADFSIDVSKYDTPKIEVVT